MSSKKVLYKDDLIQDKVYYCYYIEFSKSGFTKKVPPTPVYVKNLSTDYFELFRTKDFGGEYLLNTYNFCYSNQLSGIYESIEDCIKDYNEIIENRIISVESDYKKHINKLKKSIIVL